VDEIKKPKEIIDQHPRRILIFRALQLGDLMCTVPAFRALRTSFPEAVITLVGLPWARSFVNRFRKYIDDFIEFPGFPGFPEKKPELASWPVYLKEVHARKFDLAIQMQGSGKISNTLLALYNAKNLAGFYSPGDYCPDDVFFMQYPESGPEIYRLLRLLEFMGIPDQGDYLEFPLTERDWEDMDKLMRQHHLISGEYVCIHPGSRAESRRWPIERFAHVADHLYRKGYQVVLTGSYEDTPLTKRLAGVMESPCIDLAGWSSLGTLAALLSEAKLLVCNDTGVSHLADGLQIPSVVMFSASDPKRWAPFDRDLHRILYPAFYIYPQAVVQEVEDLLAIQDRTFNVTRNGISLSQKY
jgi:ADP-heptose:LPS heptosyltransferase